MASPSSSSQQSSPPPLFPLHPHFTAIPEGDREREEDRREACAPQEGYEDDAKRAAAADGHLHHRPPTPLQGATPSSTGPTPPGRRAVVVIPTGIGEDERAVSCNKCRPSAREKGAVLVSLDGGRPGRSSAPSSPWNIGVLRSFFSSLTWRSPRLSSCSSASTAPPNVSSNSEEEWRLAATELSQKLAQATRKRDEALMEASRLKNSMADLEKKLTGLEIYCHDLRSALDHCTHARPRRSPASAPPVADKTASPAVNVDFPLEPFLCAVTEARSALGHLTRSLVAQIRRAGAPAKAQERISQPCDARKFSGRNGIRVVASADGSLLFHLEASLSRAFFEDFESPGFQRGGPNQVLDPRRRAESNLASYAALRTLSWEDVLCRGTRHYSEGFSRFCDRKMSDVAATVLGGGACGRDGAWPEPLLQAFFGAAKWVWLVHLLAWCDHPAVPVFRVDKGALFDGGYMEDAVATDRVKRLAPAAVRAMVAPGFYVRHSLVKCKVLCMYHTVHGGGSAVNQDIAASR